jgi:hypothetical protein
MDAEQSSKCSLLKRVTENATFKRFALPNLGNSPFEESYLRFTQNPVVLAIKTALESLERKIRSFVFHRRCTWKIGYWVTRYVGKLRKTTMRNAQELSIALGPGHRLELETPVERNRPYGLRKSFSHCGCGEEKM